MKIEYKFALSASELVARRKNGKVLLSHKLLPEDGVLALDEADISTLSEGQILEAFNNYIRNIQDAVNSTQLREMPEGEAQIEKDSESGDWCLLGDVLRSVVTWQESGDDSPGEMVVRVDDNYLTGKEFLALIADKEGWGMRIEFMHPNRLLNPPESDLETPEDSEPADLFGSF